MMDDLICFANDRIVERFLANETLGQICWGFQGFPFFKMKHWEKLVPLLLDFVLSAFPSWNYTSSLGILR